MHHLKVGKIRHRNTTCSRSQKESGSGRTHIFLFCSSKLNATIVMLISIINNNNTVVVGRLMPIYFTFSDFPSPKVPGDGRLSKVRN